jgi:uncharacterized Zn-binding protein involved in type VI secretion
MARAARVGDACLETTPGAPPKVLPPGVPGVRIEGRPAAAAGGQIVVGSVTVTAGDRPLARQGDPTVTGGVVSEGCGSVEVG